MRTIGAALLVLIALAATAQPPSAGNLAPAAQLSIPAELKKTVRADKAHAGELVEFRTLEPVLVSQGVVMPANTLLRGRILSAGPKQESRNSWLALVVERAEWKQHSLPLHAFIAAQIMVSPAQRQAAQNPDSSASTSSPTRRTTTLNPRADLGTDPSLSKVIKAPQDANTTGREESGASHPWLEGIGIVRNKDGTTYLLSSKTNVRLPAGLLLMLKNEPNGEPQPATASPPRSAPVNR